MHPLIGRLISLGRAAAVFLGTPASTGGDLGRSVDCLNGRQETQKLRNSEEVRNPAGHSPITETPNANIRKMNEQELP
jgi:hypothetical protein